jgi:hypothetical protein
MNMKVVIKNRKKREERKKKEKETLPGTFTTLGYNSWKFASYRSICSSCSRY